MGALSTLENKEGSYGVGFDLKGNLGLTYWVEGAVHLEPEEYNELVVGIDYSFDVLDTWVLALQYSYNEAADLDPMALYLTDPFMPLATDKALVLSSGLNFMEDWSLQSLLYTSVDNEAGVANEHAQLGRRRCLFCTNGMDSALYVWRRRSRAPRRWRGFGNRRPQCLCHALGPVELLTLLFSLVQNLKDHSTVGRTTFSGRVGFDGLCLAKTNGGHALFFNALGRQVEHHRIGTI